MYIEVGNDIRSANCISTSVAKYVALTEHDWYILPNVSIISYTTK